MEFKCDICNRNFNSEESLNQHNSSKHINEKPKKTNFKKYFIFVSVILIVILSILSISSYLKKPGQYDEFAKCLTENGVVVYGNDFCTYTTKQLNFFGKSKQYLNYVKCVDNGKLCDEKGIDITPTWEIEGKMYVQVQNFEKLSILSGCNL